MAIVDGWDTENLISWEQVQTLAGDTAAKDSTKGLWNFLAQASSRYARRFCRRDFFQAARVVQVKPFREVFLPNGPASEIKVFLDFDRVFGPETELDPFYYGLRPDGVLEFYRELPPTMGPCLKITYLGGFSPIPEDVTEAVFEHCAWAYTRVSSRTVGQRLSAQDGYNLPVAFENPPYNVTNILEGYRQGGV